MQQGTEVTKGFTGVRARFQRLSDYRFFSGWVQDFFGERISIRSSPDVVLLTGQEFQFELHGTEKVAAFQARLEFGSDFGLYDPNTTKEEFEIRQKVLAAADVEFEFVLLDKPIYRTPNESARQLTQAARAIVLFDDQQIIGTMFDASAEGVGLILPEQLVANELYSLQIQTHLGEIRFEAKARHSRLEKQGTGTYRTGLQIQNIDRIDRARWLRLLS